LNSDEEHKSSSSSSNEEEEEEEEKFDMNHPRNRGRSTLQMRKQKTFNRRATVFGDTFEDESKRVYSKNRNDLKKH